jgi:hypothetical protein
MHPSAAVTKPELHTNYTLHARRLNTSLFALAESLGKKDAIIRGKWCRDVGLCQGRFIHTFALPKGALFV